MVHISYLLCAEVILTSLLGRFMIMNGAHQGVAGFGLASDPNLGAIMYDVSSLFYTSYSSYFELFD
jgi:hypothetical protein